MRSVTHTYGIAGVQLESGRPLPTLLEPQDPGLPRVDFRQHPATAPAELNDWAACFDVPVLDGTGRTFISVSQQDTDYLLRVTGAGDFIIRRQMAIECTPLPRVPDASIEQLLVDQVLPRALHLWLRPAFHASAVARDDAVVALVGPTTSGKSTLCAALCSRGAALVCDDCLAVEATPAGLQAHTGYSSLRLWPEAAQAIHGDSEQLPLATPRTIKRRLTKPLAKTPLWLRAVLLLEPGDGLHLEPIGGQRAVQALSAHLHRLGAEPAALDSEFRLITEVVSQATIATLRYRRGFDRIDDVATAVLDSLD